MKEGLALEFVKMAIDGLKNKGEFETYKSLEDIKASWIDDLETIKEMLEPVVGCDKT